MPFKVLISDSLSKEAVDILTKEKEFKVDVNTKLTPDDLKKVIKDYDALVVRSGTKVTKDVINAADKLKIVGRAGVGLDNVDVPAASKKGVIVVNTPGGNTMSTAEHTFSMMMALSRNIPAADLSMRKGEWERKKFMGVELYGKTLGIVGLGRIGTEVAKRALSFGMRVLAYDPYLSVEKAKDIGVESVDLKTLYKESDYITVHTPLTDETKHLISEKEFEMMKKNVRIINCARGGIIDEDALAKAIGSGRIAGAAFDVYEEEPPKNSNLLKLENVVLTPHLGASTEEAQVNVAIDVANTVRDALLGRGVKNAVNVPCLDPEICKLIDPYLKLAENIGSMHAQLCEGHIKRVKVRYVGDILKYDLTPFTVSLMKGMLTPILQESVNFVNALVIAKERGINIVETKTAEVQDFASLICVEVETEKSENLVMGTLFTKVDPRIVKINEFYVDCVPEGYMLVIFNNDVPGIIGQIGTILGKAHINIAGMSFGREAKGGNAITVLNVDCEVAPDVLDEIRRSKNIQEVRLVRL
ncbi:MAG: phosphoglycerate dehydrogenase [Candidatus Omnitrophica bacterium]|nr:phosphoglycerate dehydrogenase [Candidatus Omnitrophota bacterium]